MHNVFVSKENIQPIKEQLIPIITNSWVKEQPYNYLKEFNNIPLNENNSIVYKCKETLYDLFLNRINSIFKNYTIYENNVRTVYSYVSNKDFTNGNWHNHNTTGSISGVYYLKCIKGKGIYFRDKGIVEYFEPVENELYIFPSNLDHYPLPSITEEIRISCNLNLMCKEPIHQLFDPKNIREKI